MNSFEDYKKKLRLATREERLFHTLTNDELYWEKNDTMNFDVRSNVCCVICYESDPMVLEQHHIAGKNNSKATVTVCSNHHRILSRKQTSWSQAWTNKDNCDDIKFLFLFLGLIELSGLLDYKFPSITTIILLMVAYEIHSNENKKVGVFVIFSLTISLLLISIYKHDIK